MASARSAEGAEVLVPRLQNYQFVAGIQQGKQGCGNAFGNTANDADVNVWIHGPAKLSRVLLSQGLAQRRISPGDRVLIGLPANCLNCGIDNFLRWVEVRKTLA